MIHPILSENESESNILPINLFTNFLNYIEKTQNVKSCYANSHLINEQIVINFKELKYTIPYDYSEKLHKCKNVDYIIIPISLVYSDYSHYNIVIINNKKKTFEYFEPIGDQRIHLLPYFEVEAHIYGIVNWILKNSVKQYKFINAHLGCPMGLQKKQMSVFEESLQGQYGPKLENGKMYGYYGLCVAWCLLIIHLRILNPNENINDITSELIKNQELHKYIRQYVHLIENTSYNNPRKYIKQNIYDLKLTKNEIKYNTRDKKLIEEKKGYNKLLYFLFKDKK